VDLQAVTSEQTILGNRVPRRLTSTPRWRCWLTTATRPSLASEVVPLTEAAASSARTGQA
jgi:hypothetical protein